MADPQQKIQQLTSAYDAFADKMKKLEARRSTAVKGAMEKIRQDQIVSVTNKIQGLNA